MVWQKNGTPDTLVAPADVMTIPDLLPLKFNLFLCHALLDGTTISEDFTFNNDVAVSYALRDSRDGGTDDVIPSLNSIISGGDDADSFQFYYMINL